MRRIVWCASLFVVVGFVLFVVNQTVQVVTLAHMVHPAFGHTVLIVLLVVYALVLAVPVVLIARLPAALPPPPGETSSEFASYLSRLAERLAANPRAVLRAADRGQPPGGPTLRDRGRGWDAGGGRERVGRRGGQSHCRSREEEGRGRPGVGHGPAPIARLAHEPVQAVGPTAGLELAQGDRLQSEEAAPCHVPERPHDLLENRSRRTERPGE